MSSEIKPICGMERVKLATQLPLKTPFTAFVFPTTYCNFRCNYCGHSLGSDKMKEHYGFEASHMSMTTFKEVVKQFKMFPNKLKLLSLTGHGEPLMNKNLSKMIHLANENEIAERIEFITNGWLLTNERVDEIINSGINTIRISVQGLSSEKYKDICGVDVDYGEFIRRITYLYENKRQCQVYVKIMDIALDEGEEEKFYDTFRNISDRMFIEKCRPVYDGVSYDLKDDQVDRYGRSNKKRLVCPLPFFMLGIFPNGDVEPCDTIYKPIIIGNVHEENLYDMWHGTKLNEFRKLQLSGKRNENKYCNTCCAPNDVAHPEDDLDEFASNLMNIF